MKTKFIPQIIGLAAIVQSCASVGMVGSGAMSDDLYYDGNSNLARASVVENPQSQVSQADVDSYDSRVRSYNSNYYNNYNNSYDTDTRDFSAIQSYYSGGNKSAYDYGDSDSTYVDNYYGDEYADGEYVDDGYWDGGFWGSESDQSYAERMIKFHGPFFGVSYYSTPFYYSARCSGDWNIYLSNGYAYYVPTWSNPFYDDFYYGLGFGWSWHNRHWSFGWNWGWGYYDPWWYWGSPWYYSWGYHHRPYYYAWGHPYHHGHGYYHYQPHRTDRVGGANYRGRYYGARGTSVGAQGTRNISNRSATRYSQYGSTNKSATSSYTRPSNTRQTSTSSRTGSTRSSYGTSSSSRTSSTSTSRSSLKSATSGTSSSSRRSSSSVRSSSVGSSVRSSSGFSGSRGSSGVSSGGRSSSSGGRSR